ncbi:MAG: GTP-sensing transcriptional pleiotropic repressor CodY [Firmicutes bacterium ADurb.Bin354]|nr:MAG: GTP-sensing transcriptional pleiotropic repressor CodY [Firmicutes bacterium ADurb.Bin354]SCY00217.1 transcriptional pleiotropic repressor [Lachnospiraceae bacterium XPB1003]
MAGISLLDRTRMIGSLLHNNISSKVVFSDVCKVVSDTLDSDALVISTKGKVLGVCRCSDVTQIEELLCYDIGEHVDEALNRRFMSILSTQENAGLLALGFSWKTVHGFDRRAEGARKTEADRAANPAQADRVVPEREYRAMITPIFIGGERLGTLFIYRESRLYDIDDIILLEYAATVVGLEMMRAMKEEDDEEGRMEKNVSDVLGVTSHSELESVRAILMKLDEEGFGIVNLTKLSEESGISRTSLVNALKKMAGAGIFETRSRGVRGTEIHVVNDRIYEIKH